MSTFTFPEEIKVARGIQPGTASNSFTATDIISCKNAIKVWFLVDHYGGGGDTDGALSLVESTDVAGTTTSAVTATFPIWSNTSYGTSGDTLTRQTDAAAYTIDTGAAADELVVVEWDPAKFSSGYDCIYLAHSGGNGSNEVAVTVLVQPRYKADPPPTVITD